MYILSFEDKNQHLIGTIELKELDDIYQPSENQEKTQTFLLADVFDKSDYGINILKPTENDDDFIFIYTNSTFWDYFKPNLHEYNIGRHFKQTYPKFSEFGTFENNIKEPVNKDSRKEGLLKLYDEDNKLIKVWSKLNIIQNGLLYLCMEDQTDYYLEKEKEDTIFKYSPFPLMNINSKGEVVKINQSLTDFLGYTVQDLENKNLDDYVTTFNSSEPQIKGFMDAVNQIFNKKIAYNDSKLGLISKNGDYKWVSCHIRLIDDDLIQVSLQDLSELKQTKQETLNLTQYLSEIEETSKTAYYIKNNNQFQWTNEIFNILELDPETYDKNTNENIIKKYMLKEDIISIDKGLNELSKDAPINLEYKIITEKGNTKFIRSYVKLQKEGNHYVEIGFIQDITNEKLAQITALELEENIKEIQGFSKIFIGTLENGEYTFTPEVYNILEVNPEEVEPKDLLYYLLPEDYKKLFELFDTLTPDNPTFNFIYRVMTPKGNLKYISSYNKATFSYTGEVQKIIAFEQDVTTEIVANEKLLSLQNIISLLQGLTKIFLGEYKNGKCTFTSELCNILGVKEEEFNPNTFFKDFVIPEDLEMVKDFLNNLSPEKTYNHLTFRIKNVNNEIRYIYTCSRAEFTEERDLNSIVGFFQDVTEETLAKKDAFELQENIHDIQSFSKIFICNIENGEYNYTPEVYNILNLSPEEYTDNDLINLVAEEDREELLKRIDQLTIKNPKFKMSYSVITPEGESKIFKAFIVGKFDENDELIKVIGFIQDVTEETLVQQEALELQENIRNIQDFSRIYIYTFKDGEYTYTDGIYNIAETTKEEMPNNVLESLMLPEDSKKSREKLKNITLENPTFHNVFTGITPKGNLRHLSSFSRGIFDENGELIKIIGIVQDVTEETLKNQEALELKENLDDTLSSNKMFICTFENGKFTYTDSVYDFVECKKGEFDPDDLTDLVIPEDLKLIYEGFDNITIDNPSFKLKYRLFTFKNNLKYLKVFATGRFNDDGELIRIVNIVQDVTEETLKNQEALELKENLDDTLGSNKMFIGTYENDKFTYTDSIYDIAEAEKGEFDPDVLLDRIYPEDLKLIYEGYDNMTIDNPSFKLKYRVITLKNNLKYLKIFAKGRFNDKGELIKIINIVQDVTEETLLNMEATRLRDNFEVIQDSSKIFIGEYQNNEFSFTSEAYNILGIKPEDYPNNVDIINELIMPEDQAIYDSFMNLNMKNNVSEKVIRIKRPDGEIRYLDILNKAKFTDDGELIKFIGFIQDVTEETLIHHEALELQENIHDIQDFSKIFISTLKNGEVTYTNEVYNILGVPKDEFEGQNLLDFIVPEDLKVLNKCFENINVDNPNFQLTYRMINPDGELKYLKTFSSGKFTDDGELIKIIGFVQDVTEETLKNQEALELKENLDDTLSSNRMYIGIYENGKFTYTDSVYDIAEGKKGEFDPDDLLERVYPEDLKQIYENYANITVDNPSFKFDYRVISLKNNLLYLRMFSTGRFNDDGELIKIVSIVQDVTEETLAHQEALELQENIHDIQEFSKMYIYTLENGEYTYTDEVYDIAEVTKEEISNSDLEKFVLPEDLKIFYGKLDKLTVENPNFRCLYRAITPKGNLKYLNSFSRGKFNDDGELIKVVGIARDVTDETLAQDEAWELKDNIHDIQDLSKIFIVTVIDGKFSYTSEVYNILGVSPEEYDEDSLVNFIIPEDLEILYNKFDNVSVDNPDFKITYRLINPAGELKYFKAYATGKFTDDGELIKIIGFIQDVTEETLANIKANRLQENFSIIEEAGKIFIAELENDNFILSKTAYELLGINRENYPTDIPILKQFVLPEDLPIYNKLMNITEDNSVVHDVYRVKNVKDEILYLKVTNKGKFNDKGELVRIVGLLEDITEERLAQNEALQLQKDLSVVQRSSKIVICHSKKDKYYFTDEIYDILEIKREDYPEGFDVINYYAIENKDTIYDKNDNLTPENSNFRNVTTVKTPKGNVKVLEGFITGEFDENGELTGTIGLVQEITDKVKRERELEQLSEDRKILLQEVHHRVKNNLQIILSFLSLESRYNKDNPEYVIEQTKNRISTMALTHEEIYQSPSVSNINLESFLTKGMNNLFNLYTSGRISLYFNIEPIEVDIDKGIPLGLLTNEVALNTIKYAFPNEGEGKFFIDLKLIDDEIVLKIWDNGIGLPEGVDIFNSSSLGFIIINNLTKQLEGELTVLEDAPGFGLQLIFKA